MHKKLIITIALIIALVGVGVVAYQVLVPAIEPASTIKLNTSEWVTYENEQLGFEIKHPPEFKIEAGASTADSDYTVEFIPLTWIQRGIPREVPDARFLYVKTTQDSIIEFLKNLSTGKVPVDLVPEDPTCRAQIDLPGDLKGYKRHVWGGAMGKWNYFIQREGSAKTFSLLHTVPDLECEEDEIITKIQLSIFTKMVNRFRPISD